MADLSKDQLQRLARLGAQARLEELRREEAAIREAFPDLFRARRGRPAKHATPAGAAPAPRRGRPPKHASAAAESTPAPRGRRRGGGMSTAARKAQSERMKRYWAERRKAKQPKSAK